MVRRGLTTTLPSFTALSFYDASTGDFSIVGHNYGHFRNNDLRRTSESPEINSLSLYETSASQNLQRMDDVVVAGNLFTATIPADTFFYLHSSVLPAGLNRLWLPMIVN